MKWRKAGQYRQFQRHLFLLLCVRIEIAQLKCVNHPLFVGQLNEYKSHNLRARVLIFFTADLRTVNYNKTLLELIYFLIKC